MLALPPGATIGILGGGQLGRMLALAAAPLGFRCHIYALEAESPAFDVAAARTVAAFDDEDALKAFAAAVDVITYEFENVPFETASFLEARRPVRPGSKALRVAQDRLKEKTLARDLKVPVAPFAAIDSAGDFKAALKEVGLPAVLKTRRLGYDGKGQIKIKKAEDAEAAFAALKGVPCILEAFVEFTAEVSIIGARQGRQFVVYDAVENVHKNHILHTSTVPAELSPRTSERTAHQVHDIAQALDYCGVLAAEFFVTEHEKLLFNEIAPRVHNSGHWTMDACLVSQFEQHIRAICGWPLGTCSRHSDVVMTNLIGDEAAEWKKLASKPLTAVHLYGKSEARPGRKMGHINRLSPRHA
jgi:5-(carboxyamino)imidazole ribonucleotide synthase